MRKEVIVSFAPGREVEIALHADTPAMAVDDARRWLDEQFVANDCEPLRASGKVLKFSGWLEQYQSSKADAAELIARASSLTGGVSIPSSGIRA